MACRLAITIRSPLYLLSFSDGPAHHLDLHSFPTRRSSDLLATAPGGLTVMNGTGFSVCAVCGSPEPGAVHHRDRKSTRLNSSHVSISYAVFCLKKKKVRHSRRTVLVLGVTSCLSIKILQRS